MFGKNPESNIPKFRALFQTLKLRPRILVFGLIAAGVIGFLIYSNRFIRRQEPDYLTFNELKQLSQNPHPRWLLKMKLDKFWKTPVINNQAYYQGKWPPRHSEKPLGPFLRLVTWNIEKSFHVEDAISVFSAGKNFEGLIDETKAPPGSKERELILHQREKLTTADVIILQEMDIKHKRSGYINAAGKMAEALHMNYAFGAEQLEVDPVILGLEKVHYEDGTVDQQATDYYAADPNKYKGVFGGAVLSRYPIKKVKVFQLKSQAYDWGIEEKKKIGFFEETRRTGAEWIFKNQITREVKAGGRIFFQVDLDVPGLPQNTLTIINIHLEIKCQPEGREKQMAEILSYIKNISHPVIVAGDFNAAPEDLSATSAKRIVERTAKNPTTWFTAAVSYLLPQALLINTTRFVSNFTKNLQDPLAPDIAVIAPNPVHALFRMIQNFRFNDGGAFDFRGDAERSINGNSGTLANSNERDTKGFETTFSVKRPIAAIFGKYRLDWIFVKSRLNDPFDKKGSYRFAPHYGETLEEMNTHLKTPISDHQPSVVDLPFKEPNIKSASPVT